MLEFIYQDGLVADGDLDMKIVKTAAEIGSKNYLLIYYFPASCIFT